jgi:hypothetical protein
MQGRVRDGELGAQRERLARELLALLVEDDVEARVGGVADRRRRKALEEAAYAVGRQEVPERADERAVL